MTGVVLLTINNPSSWFDIVLRGRVGGHSAQTTRPRDTTLLHPDLLTNNKQGATGPTAHRPGRYYAMPAPNGSIRERWVSTLSSSCGAEKSAAVSAMAPRIKEKRDMMNDDMICRAAVGLSGFAKLGEKNVRGRRK